MERTSSAALALLISALMVSPRAAGAAPGAPVVEHEPLTSFPRGEAVTLKARIHSPIGKRIFAPAVFMRLPGLEAPARIPLVPVPGEANAYAAKIPPNLTQADFDYYIEAFDEEGNGPSRLASPEAPIRAKAVAAALPPPPPSKVAGAGERAAAPVVELEAAAGRPWQRTAGIAALGVGGALLAGALAFGGVALVARGEVARAADGAQFDAAMKRAQSNARVANTLAAAGAVAGGAGAVLLLVSPKDGGGALAAVGVGAGPAGAGLLIQGRF